MWPLRLNLTSDECRRTLRRLELEAYSNMISVFRAQGTLEENRKKLLEELRAVLHISNDRHSAEARRVANDELLATIAEQLAGPNTGIAWICEGRRRIPLMPRGIAQTMYTEIADKAAELSAAENKETQKKLEAEQLVAPKSSEEEELPDAEGQTAEGALLTNSTTEEIYPPIAMEDQTTKIWEAELTSRKRKVAEVVSSPSDEEHPPTKNMRNIPANSNQKHLNLAQIYSKYSQVPSKPSSQSKHSYNQVSKVSTTKSNVQHGSRSQHKNRAHKQNIKNQSAKPKKSQEQIVSPSKQFNSNMMRLEYSDPSSSFQANYAQSVLGSKNKSEYIEEMKPKVLSSPGMVSESPSMQLMTQAGTVPHELELTASHHEDAALQAQATPSRSTITGKSCQLIIKKRGEIATDKKVQMSDLKIIQKSDGVKIPSSRHVVVAANSTPKALNVSGKIVTPKVFSSVSKPQVSTPILTDKMIVVSKPPSDQRTLANPKIVVTSSANTHIKDRTPIGPNNVPIKMSTTELLTPKGIPATDLKVSAKAIVLGPKSGQKMVVLPRAKPGSDRQVPLLHFKGVPTAMKLVSVSSQSTAHISKTVLPANAAQTKTKILGIEPIKTANMADIVPVKGLTPVTTPKISNPILRTANTKRNVIVVPKGATIGKSLSFTKNGNDMSKVLMGKNVNQLLQSKPDQMEVAKREGNVIVLELNNDQSGHTTTMSEILDSRNTGSLRVDDPSKLHEITQDTPVLFDNQISETCNASSLDSAVDSIGDIVPLVETDLIQKHDPNKDPEGVKDTSSVTDWEIDLDSVSRKEKDDDKLNSLHLDLGMSSDSDNEYMVESHESQSKRERSIQGATSGGELIALATRTLLSGLQDDGSSSNDSSFALKSKCVKKDSETKMDKTESEELNKAKEKLSEKVADAKSRQKRIDVYSTAITSTDNILDPFSYLDEGLLVGDDVFSEEGKTRESRHDQLSRLLAEDSQNSTDSQTVSESLPLNKP